MPRALPGERIKARVKQVKKSYARGELEKVLVFAADRINPVCRNYIHCGGCNLQHLDYKSQLEYKKQIVINALVRIGKLEGINVKPVLGMEYPWHYRNKVHLQVEGQKGNLKLGFFAVGSHRIVSHAGNCFLVDKRLNNISIYLQKLLNNYNVEPYYWGKRRGFLRHVMLREGKFTGQVMVVLITVPGKWEEEKHFARDLMQGCPEVVSVIRNINNGPRKMVLGNKNVILAGNDSIKDYLCGLIFNLSANSFYQVNSIQAEQLYKKVLEFTALSGNETTIDAYCGTGTIALYLAQHVSRVIGVESVPSAVLDARKNADLNGINNAEFKTGKVENLMAELAGQGAKPDVVVLDPPRKGCEKKVLQAISSMEVPRVVYVSCDPGTLARDLGRLQDLGYYTAAVQPVDMFPWTSHVECAASIERE